MRKQGRHLLSAVLLWAIVLIFSLPLLFLLIEAFLPKIPGAQNLPSNSTSFMGNFILAWQQLDFLYTLITTSLITALATAGIIFYGAMAAYALQRFPGRVSRIFFVLFLVSLLVPFQTFMLALVPLTRELGLRGLPGIIPLYWGLGCPLAMLLLHSFLKGIPTQWEDMAATDGAGPFRIFFQIFIPLLTPVFPVLVTGSAFWIWNDFLLPLLILPRKSTLPLALFTFFNHYRDSSGAVAAALLLSALPAIGFYLGIHKFILGGKAVRIKKQFPRKSLKPQNYPIRSKPV